MLDLDEMKTLRDDIRHWPGGTAHRVVKALTELIEEVERLREQNRQLWAYGTRALGD